MTAKLFSSFKKIINRYSKPVFQLGVYFHKSQLYATLIENRGLDGSAQISNHLDGVFKIIESSKIDMKNNQNSQLFALNSEDSKKSFEQLVDAIGKLKSKLNHSLALKLKNKRIVEKKDYLKVAIALPENSFFFKTIAFETKNPSENSINQKLQAKMKNSGLDINIADYHFDYSRLNQSTHNHNHFHFCLIKQLLVEKLTSAFDLNQMQVELITIGDYLKVKALFDCAMLETNQIGGVIKIADDQLYFLSHHQNFGMIQIDKPLWFSNQNLTDNLINFVDSAISSNPELKAITAVMLEIDTKNKTFIEQKNDCLNALEDYLKEYYPDCSVYDVDDLIEPTNLNINQLIALKAATELTDTLLP